MTESAPRPLSAEERARLQALIEPLPRGAWESKRVYGQDEPREPWWIVVPDGDFKAVLARVFSWGPALDGGEANRKALAAYLAAVSPDVVRALLDQLERAEGRIAQAECGIPDTQAAARMFGLCPFCLQGWPE